MSKPELALEYEDKTNGESALVLLAGNLKRARKSI
jgi:hypothetical protein